MTASRCKDCGQPYTDICVRFRLAAPRPQPQTSSGTPGVGATEPSAINRQDGGIAVAATGAPSAQHSGAPLPAPASAPSDAAIPVADFGAVAAAATGRAPEAAALSVPGHGRFEGASVASPSETELRFAWGDR